MTTSGRLTPQQAKIKAARFCAYQERSQQEVRNKLYDYGLYSNDVEQVLTDLISEGFINEERFAKAFVLGKFRIKKWGRVKILNELYRHKLSNYCIKKGLSEIDESDYLSTLDRLIKKKQASLDEANEYIEKQKIARYVISKGYEPELVWEALQAT